MNYYDARRLEDGTGWHYTSFNRRLGTCPVGYCAQWHEDKTHVHATQEEARECFRKYLLDGWREVTYGDWTGCEFDDCGSPTKKGLATRPPLGGLGIAFCDEHRTYENLEAMTPPVGQITASY